MPNIILSRILWAIALIALQPLVFNHIHLFGYATPMPYIYVLLILPSTTPRWLYILLGFLLGCAVDIFSNTYGMAAASTTLIGLCTPFFLKLYGPKDFDPDNFFLPGFNTLEVATFLIYAGTLLLIHTVMFFTLEAFSFSNYADIFFNVVGSTLLSLLFIALFERFR